MHMEEAYTTWHFSIILISLRAEVEQSSDFFSTRYNLAALKSFFLTLNLPH